MTILRNALIGASALALVACASSNGDTSLASAPAPISQTPLAAPAQSAHDALFALFNGADAAELKLSPIAAMFRGDYSQADRLGDIYTDELEEKTRQLAESNLAALHAIDRAQLDETDLLAYEVFETSQNQTLSDFEPRFLAVTRARPMNHFFGLHTFYPTLESGESAAPFRTVRDYQNALGRHADYARIMDRAIGRFREGLSSGVLETSLTIFNMVEQLDTQLALPLEQSPFWQPITNFPEDFSTEDKTRIEADFRRSLPQVYAANRRMRDFLKNEYLPRARTSVGLSDMKGGAAFYEKLIRDTTTLPLTAEYLHQLGLAEVARIHGEMEKIKHELGFAGSLNQFFDHLRADPKLTPQSREWLTQDYYRIGRLVDERVGTLFSVLPKTPLEIRPYEPFREKFEAGGSYSEGSPDGSRPGTFYFNAYDLPSRPVTGNVTLYLHEGAPGHHFQISLAQENEALPPFMRFGGNTAYVKGWALYAETLGFDMGLYDDPYSRFGTLDDEIFRAIRLVVDTGIHAKGWTRDSAIEYMLANSGKGRTDATAEIERYIAIPSQALAYKVGALKIQELRGRAQTELGDRFDIKAFHAQVLGTGALPLDVLERKIDSWIAAQKAG